MRQTKIKRVRRAVRLQRKEKLELERESSRVGVAMGWRYDRVFMPALPLLRYFLPATWVCWLGNRAVRHARWRYDLGDWRPFDPPRYFTPADFGGR